MEYDSLVQECKYDATLNKYFVSIKCTITKETTASNAEDAEDELWREINDCFEGGAYHCYDIEVETEEI
jgi:hypothetical protein